MRIARVIAASAAIALSSVDAFAESPQIAAVSGRDQLALYDLATGTELTRFDAPGGSSVAAGYMTIKNSGSTPDRLISGSSDVAPKFEVHEMKMEDGIAKMRPVKGGLEIKPGETVELKPGSFHVMFVGLKKPLSAGDQFKATLVFEKAGSVNIDYDVRAMGSQPGGAMPGMKH